MTLLEATSSLAPDQLLELRECRASDPDAVLRAATKRSRRSTLPPDGRLLLVAADHAARGALRVQGDDLAMADRDELLTRLATALRHPGVDGVLGTADILEDLLLLGALEDKVVIGSMNRGGLAGSSFEVDDRFTGYHAEGIQAMGFDGGKMLTRVDLEDPASVATLEAAARAIDELTDHALMAMVEPFISRRQDGRLTNDLSTAAVVHAVSIASGLAASSRRTWLKLPVVEDMAAVMAATTLPTLLLGGDPTEAPETYRAKWADAMLLPGVRGLIAGRALLYPADDDVHASVEAAVSIVHPDNGMAGS